VFSFDDEGLDAVYTSNKTNAATNGEFSAISESFEEVRRERLSLGSRPLVVITAGQSDVGEWHALQLDLLTRSTKSRRIVAEGSGHYVQDERPALVLEAIRDVVEQSRNLPAN
jgi:pimeloyl-ACP methyl ester carboxylesterase